MSKVLSKVCLTLLLAGLSSPIYATAADGGFPSRVWSGATQWVSDQFYGSAFRHTSVTNEGCKAGDPIPYFQSKLPSLYKQKSIVLNGQPVVFWESNAVAGDGFRHVIVESFAIRGTKSFYRAFTLDSIPELTWPNTGKVCSFTCSVLQEIMGLYPKISIHVLVDADGKHGRDGQEIHTNYLQVTSQAEEGVQFKIFEPWGASASWGYPSYDNDRAQQLRLTLSENGFSNFQVNLITRGDQKTNPYDCQRFSLIYLMFALEGRSVEQLKSRDIYEGIQRFVVAPDGFLSFQRKKISSAEANAMVEGKRIPTDLMQDYVAQSQFRDWTKERWNEELNGSLRTYVNGVEQAKNDCLMHYIKSCNVHFSPEFLEKTREFSAVWGEWGTLLEFYTEYSNTLNSGIQEREMFKILWKCDWHCQLEQTTAPLQYTPSLRMQFVQTCLGLFTLPNSLFYKAKPWDKQKTD